MARLNELYGAVGEHNVLAATIVVDAVKGQLFFSEFELERSGEIFWQVLKEGA